MPMRRGNTRLEEQDRDQLLQTARTLLAEADALSSRIAAVNEIGIAINRTLDIAAILHVVGKQAKWLLDFEYCSVCLQPPAATSWQVVTLFGKTEPEPDDLLATTTIGHVLRTGQPRLIQLGENTDFMGRYASQFILPLVAENRVMGTLNFATTKSAAYTGDDMRIGYMLALQLSSALRNAHNFEALKQARDALTQYTTELEERNRELDAFGHTIAHDLKSPLNVILLQADFLKMRYADDLPDEASEHMNGIREGVMKMTRMIDQLLWLARLRHVTQTENVVEIKPIIESAIARFAPAITARHIKIKIAEPIPNALGHAAWVEEVFANLISNAIKYMGSANGRAQITVKASVQDTMVRYEVQDTGIGINAGDMSDLFTMFTRLNDVPAEGLGLGLSIVHRIVTKLNGQVGVESKKGKGSTFWFTLPAMAQKTGEIVVKQPA
jgi:signal transduction histidine kinase